MWIKVFSWDLKIVKEVCLIWENTVFHVIGKLHSGNCKIQIFWNHSNVVSTVTAVHWTAKEVMTPCRDKSFFFYTTYLDQFWGLTNLPYEGYWELFPLEWSEGGPELTTLLCLLPGLTVSGTMSPCPHMPFCGMLKEMYLYLAGLCALPLY